MKVTAWKRRKYTVKKFLSLLLAVCLCTGMIPAHALTEEDACEVICDEELVFPEEEPALVPEEESELVPEEESELVPVEEATLTPAEEPTGDSAAAETDASVRAGYTEISDPIGLWLIRNDMAGNYILTSDIDLGPALASGGDLYNAEGWLALGYADNAADATPFTGTLDGDGHCITGLKCLGKKAGLFCRNDGTIKNLTITGTIESTASFAGGLATYNYGTIENCHTNVKITLSSIGKAGGITAYSYNGSTIRNCSNRGEISTNGPYQVRDIIASGGIAALSLGTVDRCWNTGTISTTGDVFFKTGNNDHGCFAGGIVGEVYPWQNCLSEPTITNCYNTGSIICSNICTENNTRTCSGGIAGCWCDFISFGYTLDSCYNTGLCTVTDPTTSSAPLVGAITGRGGSRGTNCYYLNNMDRGRGGTSEDTFTSLSPALMRRQASFSGFDFDSVWEMGTGSYLYPVLRHDHLLWHYPAVQATCYQTGNIEYWYCRACDRYFADSQAKTEISQADTVTPKAHNYVDEVTDPTCTERGYTTHTCALCGDSYVDTWVNALGHDYQDTVTGPTCTEGGYTTHVCCRCADTYVDSYTDALGHSYVDTVTDPTCTEGGYTTHVCRRCAHKYVDSRTDALGHDYRDTITAPTCIERGCTTHTCSRCGDSYTDTYVDALGHDYRDTITAPTCTERGCTAHTCSHCGDSYADTYVDALGHDWGEWTVTTAASCTEGGREERVCTRCGEKESRATEALGHDYQDTVTEPTCTERGYTAHTCSRCGDSYVDTYVDALGHDWEEWSTVKAADCTEEGQETRACVRCGERENRTIEALGHDYTESVTPPTCTEDGYTTHTCSRCGDSYVDGTVEALGHDWEEPAYTWAEDNSTVTGRAGCRRDAAHLRTETARSSYSVSVPATCENPGTGTYVARFTQEPFTEQRKTTEIPAEGHRYVFGGFTWSEDYTSAVAGFVCENNSSHTHFEDAEVSVRADPGTGKTIFTAAVEFEGKTYTETKEAYTSAVIINGVSLTLKGQIGIYVYAQVPAEAKTAKLTYPKTGEVKTFVLNKDPGYYVPSSDQYKFLYENVPAKELTQPLELEVFDANGSALPIVHSKLGPQGTKFTCKAVDYCNTILANPASDPKLQNLVKAILNYGQCAQIQFEFDTDNPANPEGYLSEEMKTVKADAANDPVIPANAHESVGWEYGTLTLKGAVSANLYFSKAITASDAAGNPYTVTPKSNNRWVITFDNIPAKNLGDKYIVVAGYGGKTIVLQYSALSYVNAVLGNPNQPENLKELCKAMILYNKYAKAYFGN